MSCTAKIIECDDETREQLERSAHSQRTESRLVRRAMIVLWYVEGKRIMDLAGELGGQFEEMEEASTEYLFAHDLVSKINSTACSLKSIACGRLFRHIFHGAELSARCAKR